MVVKADIDLGSFSLFAKEDVEILENLLSNTVDSAAFLTPSEDLAEGGRAAAKVLYKCTAAQLKSIGSTAAASLLPELHTNGFDAEQIWQQLEMQSAPLIGKAKRIVHRTTPDTPLLEEDAVEVLEAALAEEDEDEEDLDQEDAEEQGNGEDEDSGEEDDDQLADEEDEEDEEDEPEREEAGRKKSKRKENTVEDDFLDLDQMERFLSQAEEQHAKIDEERDEDSEEDEDEEEDDDDGEFSGRGEGEEEEEDSADEDRLDDVDDDEEDLEDEDDLEAALAYTSKLAGVKRAASKSSSSKGAENAMYADLFGKAPSRSARKSADEEDEEEPEEEDEEDEEDEEKEESEDEQQ
eukprot:gene6025-7239_t